jgi:glycine oxidase
VSDRSGAGPAGAPRPDVLVAGGGVIGLACARELARRGLAVELLERDLPGAGASAAAAGLIAPLAEVPEPGPLLDACLEARDAWPGWLAALEEESGREIEHDDSGALLVARDAAEEAHIDRMAAAARRLGEPVEEVTPEWVLRQVPDLTPEVGRCLLLPGELRVDNPALCGALAAAAAAAGVVVRPGARIDRIDRVTAGAAGGVRVKGRENGVPFAREAPLLVLAAGAWSGAVPGLPELPVGPLRGQMLRIEGVGWPWRGSVRGPVDYAVRRGAEGLLVGATVEEAGFEVHPTPEGLHRLLGFALDLFPGLAGRPVSRIWAGLRPGSADDLPLVGRIDSPGGLPVLVATGHFRNGLLLAPWTAGRIAELALDPGLDDRRHPFSPTRFAARARPGGR